MLKTASLDLIPHRDDDRSAPRKAQILDLNMTDRTVRATEYGPKATCLELSDWLAGMKHHVLCFPPKNQQNVFCDGCCRLSVQAVGSYLLKRKTYIQFIQGPEEEMYFGFRMLFRFLLGDYVILRRGVSIEGEPRQTA